MTHLTLFANRTATAAPVDAPAEAGSRNGAGRAAAAGDVLGVVAAGGTSAGRDVAAGDVSATVTGRAVTAGGVSAVDVGDGAPRGVAARDPLAADAVGAAGAVSVGNGVGRDAVLAAAVPAVGVGVGDGVGRDVVLAAAVPAVAAGGGAASGTASVGVVAGRLDALVTGLRALGGECPEECLTLVGRSEAALAAVKSEVVASLARRDGEARTAEVVRDRLRQSRGGAKSDVKLAGQLADLPDTSRALAGGVITPQHAKMIADACEHTPVEEAELVAAAEREPVDVFARTVRDHVNDRSGDDLEERRKRQRAQRRVSLSKKSDGMYELFGKFDPIAGNRIETALAAMAKKLWVAEDPKNRSTPAQRFADALELLVTRNGAGKAQGTNLLVIADYDTVAGQLADARLVDGTPVAASELLKLALEAKILPALFDAKEQPLWLGREHRHASDAQRIALAARDRGCVGCGTSNNVCQPHHIIHWEHDGPTDIDNLCLLCGDCHQKQVHTNGADIHRAPTGKYTLQHPPNPPPPTCRNHLGRRRGTGSSSAGGTINHPLRR